MNLKEKKSEAAPAAGARSEPKPLHVKLLKFFFGHVGMFILVSAIAALGALLFIHIESEAEEHRYLVKRNKAKDMEDGAKYLTSYWWHFAAKPNLTYEEWERKVRDHLSIMNDFVVDAVNTYEYDGTVDGWVYEWTVAKALLYTITIMTTIGYGHIYPRTPTGQLVTILYAMIGTPLLLVFLANIGDGMANIFTYTYSRICCRWCRSSRYQSERTVGKKAKRLSDDVVGREPYMPTDQVQVPIVINLMLICVYLALGAIIFSKWEDWDFTAAYYFSFVTLSTIGFGDMVPGNSFLDNKDGVVAGIKMGVTISYCIIGMALISMCIQMMQEQIVTKVRWAGLALGLIQSEEHQRRSVHLRRTKRGAVPETDYLADGNLSRPVTTDKKRKRRKKRQEAGSADGLGRSAPEPPRATAAAAGDARAAEADDRLLDDDSDDDIFNLA